MITPLIAKTTFPRLPRTTAVAIAAGPAPSKPEFPNHHV
jgi:hypothetical protein